MPFAKPWPTMPNGSPVSDDFRPSSRLVIESLHTTKHERAGFSCGIARLDNFLHRTARKQQAADFTRVRVLVEDGEPPILGYYALNAHALETVDDPPPEMARHAPRSGSIPAIYLSMIAVDQRHQGRGLGRILLADALDQAVGAAERIGIKAVVLDVIEDGGPELAERRREFYLAMGFQPFPSRPTRLFICIETVRAARE